MEKSNVALLRIPAFIIDFMIVMLVIGTLSKSGTHFGVLEKGFSTEILLFVCIPLGFFIYWTANINLGKRLFRLKVINATSGKPPSIGQYFIRSLLMSLVVSLNILFLLPVFLSKRNQGFHDMLANTVVIRKEGKS